MDNTVRLCGLRQWSGRHWQKKLRPYGQNIAVPAADQALEDFDGSVFRLINQERAVHGRGLLRPNASLQRAAFDHATSMEALEAGGFFSHYGDFLGHSAAATPVSRPRQVG